MNTEKKEQYIEMGTDLFNITSIENGNLTVIDLEGEVLDLNQEEIKELLIKAFIQTEDYENNIEMLISVDQNFKDILEKIFETKISLKGLTEEEKTKAKELKKITKEDFNSDTIFSILLKTEKGKKLTEDTIETLVEFKKIGSVLNNFYKDYQKAVKESNIKEIKNIYNIQNLKNKEEFHMIIGISNDTVFEINFYTLGRNKSPYFSTSAGLLTKIKNDYQQCGQAQNDLLEKDTLAYKFYKDWDYLHTKDMTEEEYNTMINGGTIKNKETGKIEEKIGLKELLTEYPYKINLNGKKEFNFREIVDFLRTLPKTKEKQIKKTPKLN